MRPLSITGGPRIRPSPQPSLRRRAFAAFDAGHPPDAVADALSAKPATIARYYRLWRRRPLARRIHYRMV